MTANGASASPRRRSRLLRGGRRTPDAAFGLDGFDRGDRRCDPFKLGSPPLFDCRGVCARTSRRVKGEALQFAVSRIWSTHTQLPHVLHDRIRSALLVSRSPSVGGLARQTRSVNGSLLFRYFRLRLLGNEPGELIGRSRRQRAPTSAFAVRKATFASDWDSGVMQE